MANQGFAARSVERDHALVAASSFFDAHWYLEQDKALAERGIDPVRHYLERGAHEGRDPGPHFHSATYLKRRPDIAAAGWNPLVHFLRCGIAEISENFTAFGIGVRAPEPEPRTQVMRAKGGPKAVFVTHDMNIGGAPRLLASIASWFQRRTDYDVHIVAMYGGPLQPEFEAVAPLHVVGYTEVPDEIVPDLRAAIRAFVGEEPAFTFVNSAASGDYCRIDPFDAPTIAYVHEMPKILAMFKKHFRSLVDGADHVLCGGIPVYQHFKRLGGFADSQLTTRPAFVDDPAERQFLSTEDKRRRKAALGWPTTKTVVACGVANWRKQPEIFVRLAANLVLERGCDARFVWIGGGEDAERMTALAASLGLGNRVEFLGYRSDHRELIAAADVFALPSIEDPFPLVCLDAAIASTPSVVFREATGMIAMIEPEGGEKAGVAVPLGDEEAYFAAVHALLTDDEAREFLGRTARDRVLRHYTADAACPEILGAIRQVAKLAPRVSILVPSYNCAPYLAQRLSSIAAQTFKDTEIILLDDRSTDNSRTELLNFSADHPSARLILADQNGGGVFEAWSRAISAATGDLVWIAEADDWCEPTFLANLVPTFHESGVRLAHGRSIPVNTNGEISGDWNDLHLDAIAIDRWRTSYVEAAAREVALTLGQANTIPNASAAVTLRGCALRAVEVAKQFRFAGDWAFYLTAIAGGRIAYNVDATSYHRRHDRSVTHKFEGSAAYFQELSNIGALVNHVYGNDPDRERRRREHLESEARRFGFTAPLPTGQMPAQLMPQRRPGVMFCVGDLSGGGAQMFAIRFVNRWAREGIPAVLLVVGHDADHPATRARLSPEVPIVRPEDVEARGLAQFMRDWGLDIIVSGHWWADCQIGKWKDRQAVPQPWIIVMHGCYENVLSATESFPTMRKDFARAERNCDQWVWTAEKNKLVFDEGYIRPRRTRHIVNGFEPVQPTGLKRGQLGLPDGALVFTLASRAIEEKGWLIAIEALRKVRNHHAGRRDIWLQLIGDGPVAQQMRSEASVEGIRLIHHTSRLADYIAVSDVCLLPSWFAGESLPLVVIEFLAQGKPAIVSDIGMCAWAIQASDQGGDRPAGLVVPRRDGRVTAEDLAAAMTAFVTDGDLARDLGVRASAAFDKFNFDRMIGEYVDVFDTVLTEAVQDSDARRVA